MPLGRGGGVNSVPSTTSTSDQDPHLRSHGKIGDCEQSNTLVNALVLSQFTVVSS